MPSDFRHFSSNIGPLFAIGMLTLPGHCIERKELLSCWAMMLLWPLNYYFYLGHPFLFI